MKKLLLVIVCSLTALTNFAKEYAVFYKWRLTGSDLYSTDSNHENVSSRRIVQKGYVYGYFDDENISWSQLKLIKYWKDKTDKQFYYTIEPFMYGNPDIIRKKLSKGDIWEFACVGESLKSEIMKKSFKVSDNLELRIPRTLKGTASWNNEFADGSISVGSGKIKMTLDSKKIKDYYDIGSFTDNDLLTILKINKYQAKELNQATSRYGSTIVYLAEAIFEVLGVGNADNFYLFPAQAGSPGEVLVFDDAGDLAFQPISSRDAYLLNRANHIGTQSSISISDFDDAASKASQVVKNKDTLDNLNIPPDTDLSQINDRLTATEEEALDAGTAAATADGKAVTAQNTADTANTQANANKNTLDNLNIPPNTDLSKINDRLTVTEEEALNAGIAASTADGKAVAAQNTANTANTQASANKTTLDNLNIPPDTDLSQINDRLTATETVAVNAGTAAAAADSKAVAAQNTANTANTQASANKNTLDNLNIPPGTDLSEINTRLTATEGVANGADTKAATAQNDVTSLRGELKPVAKSASYNDLIDTPSTPNPYASHYTLIANMNSAENTGAGRYFIIDKTYAAEGSLIFGIPASSGGDDIHIILPSANECNVNDSLRFYCSTLSYRLCYIQIGAANQNPSESFFNAQRGDKVYQLRTASTSYGEFSYVTFHVIPDPENPTEKKWFFHDCSDTEWSTDLTLPVYGFPAGTSEGTLTVIDNTINHPEGINSL